jgi:hypothetical protein
MYEFEKYEYEFSKIYKRMLRLELLIKHKIINLSTKVYKNDVMNVFSKFFNNAHIYNKYCSDTKKENYFLAIRDSKSIDNIVKFERIINMLMLRHTLHFIFTEEAFRIDEIKNEFYAIKIEKFKELRNNREALISLRNHIAHFNFRSYDLLLTNALGFIMSDLRSTKSEIEFYTTIVDQDFSITKLKVTIFSCKGELDFNFKENDLVFARYQDLPKENLKSRNTFYSEREIDNN